MLINIWRVGVRRMGPDSFQWCPATGQGATGTNWSIGSSSWTWRTSSLWGWRSTGTGCPQGLWSLLLWRYSKPTWTRSCAACCRWPCFGRGVWTRWSPEVPSNTYHPVILWHLFIFSTSHMESSPGLPLILTTCSDSCPQGLLQNDPSQWSRRNRRCPKLQHLPRHCVDRNMDQNPPITLSHLSQCCHPAVSRHRVHPQSPAHHCCKVWTGFGSNLNGVSRQFWGVHWTLDHSWQTRC